MQLKYFIYLILITLISALSCDRENIPDITGNVKENVHFNINAINVFEGEPVPAESSAGIISDLNLFIFDKYGGLNKHFYYTLSDPPPFFNTDLDKIEVYAVANWGSDMNNPVIYRKEFLENKLITFSSLQELEERQIFTGFSGLVNINNGVTVNVELKRIFAKLTIVIDKTGLDNTVNIEINKFEIKNSSNTASLFNPFRAELISHISPTGYRIDNPYIANNHEDALHLPLA